MSIGSVNQAEEIMEEDALSLEQRLMQKKQRERVRPIEVEPVSKLRRAVLVDVETTVTVCRQSVPVEDSETTAPSPNSEQLQDNAFPIDLGTTLHTILQRDSRK